MKLRVFQLIFGLILFIGICLRFYQLGKIPVALYWDETAILVDAKSVAQTGLDMHARPWFQVIYPSYGDFKLPVYIWLAAITVKIFGVNEFALRLPSALMGVVSVWVGGVLAKEVASQIFVQNKQKKLLVQLSQLCTMLVLAVSPWSVMFSRTGFEGNVGQSLLAISAWLIWISRQKWFYIIPAALIGSLATYAYFSVRFVWPALIVCFYGFFILWPAIKKLKLVTFIKQFVIYLLLPILIFSLLLLPMLRSPLYQDMNKFRLSTSSILNAYDYPVLSNQLREQAGNQPIDRLIFHRYWLLLKELAENYQDNLSFNFMFVSGDPNLRHGTGQFGLFVLPMIAIFLSGLYEVFNKDKTVFFWLIIWWLVALLPASVPENTPHALRSLNALIPLAVIMGIGLTKLYLLYQDRFSNFSQSLYKFGLGSYLVWTILASVSFIYFYFNQYPIDSADAWLDGYKQVALIADQQKDSVQEIYVSGDDKIYLWLMAYGQVDAKTVQSWPSQGYQYSHFDKVQFKQFDFSPNKTIDKKYLIIGQYDQLKSSLQQSGLTPAWQQTITAVDGKNKFFAIKLEP
jgi:4-amino-4-deoxy-L-arabinose transferase-like glycosyltransferase